ncbi:cAMP-dependent protein kinase regulatory subunit-like [Tubulanus polymorphus]|uniref:cAMP-dependent protein kinase regulatory subunit-like n=1 Tax=Tubulanus polymorphus TaxID=672921 RepID=UPI003DA4BCF3
MPRIFFRFLLLKNDLPLSLQVPKPGEISEVAKIQKVERCLLTLPFVDALSDETIDSVAKKATVKDFARTTTFITAGSEAQGIYILVEGRVEILANDETVMAEIDVNDFVGEVSVLYGTPATASVRAESQTVMLFIDKNTVKSIGKLKREMHINQWFITRKYLPTSKLVDKQLITEGVLSDALKNVPLFRDWCQASMIELIKCTDGIVVYPPHSFITYTGDPGHEVILLIKGKYV